MIDQPIREAVEEQMSGPGELSIEARSRFQTLRRSFEAICTGEEPWIALGKFMHQFFGEFKNYREELVRDPIHLPIAVTAEQFQWAVFCAASAEYLCYKYSLDCPQWAHEPAYSLTEPWYHGLGADRARVQEKLRVSTPSAFARRNIFCGDRVFANKYEPGRVRRSA